MKNATALLALAALAATASGCRKKAAEHPECRIFEQDPVQADPGTIERMKEAYSSTARIADCARAAQVSVEEFLSSRKVEQHLHEAEQILESAPQTIVEGAQSTIKQVKSGAEEALEAAQRKAEQEIKAIQDMAQ